MNLKAQGRKLQNYACNQAIERISQKTGEDKNITENCSDIRTSHLKAAFSQSIKCLMQHRQKCQQEEYTTGGN